MKRLPLEALAQYTYLSGLNLNPQGSLGAYVTHTANLEDNSYNSDIWLFDVVASADGNADGYADGNADTVLANHHPRRLTTSGKAAGFEWLPSGDRLIYPSAKDPAVKAASEGGEPLTVYYALPVNGGESTEFMRIPMRVSQIHPLSETLFIVSAQHHPEVDRYNASAPEARPAILKEWKDEANYEVIEEIPFWSNGGTFLRGARNRLYAYCNQDKVLLPLTDVDTAVGGWHYEPQLDRLVAISRTYRGKAPLKSAVHVADGLRAKLAEVDFATADQAVLMDQLKCVFPQGTHAIHYAYSLDQDSLVLLGHDGSTHGLNQNATFQRLNLLDPIAPQTSNQNGAEAAPTLMPFAPSFTGTVGNTVGSDTRYGSKRNLKSLDGVLYFVSTERENAYLNRLMTDGHVERLTPAAGSVDDFALTDAQTIMITAMRENHLAEVFQLFNGLEVPVTQHNAWVHQEHPLAVAEPLSVNRGVDAKGAPITVEGWVLRPALVPGDDEGYKHKGKAILNIHGGPKTVYGTVFYHEMQYWANLGYHVLFCNPRGSDGKGNDFADIRGKYGTIDYDDIMAFVDQVLVHYPDIDAHQLYVTGGSYGGFMTNWIVGHTNRFRAAASQRSISNWTTEYGVTDIGYYFVPDQMGVTPWSDYEKLWEMSPLKYAPAIETPLLLEHSDQDYRCWLPEALQLFTALKDMGKEARIIMTKGENHELSRSGKPKSRIRRIEEITNWFELY